MELLVPLIVAGYLLGSVPTGGLVARRLLRRPPPGNPAPLELYERAGRLTGALAALLEVAKGGVPALAGYLALGMSGAVWAGSAAVFGHAVSIFMRGGGGKGVSPVVGVLLIVHPLVVIILAMVWTAALSAWRYASLAALVAAAVTPLALAAVDAGNEDEGTVLAGAVFWALLVFFEHRENIRRLINGREVRFRASPRRRLR
ncbi:glycerol-3-phosphate acyltransferase [Rubrobacter taiwanensis]|uniref:Glycerol-3-phosphate acyltransferase n=1 Tax=Rubrobacter taiwanensis TaxID=185139 RepID=A0A4R1BHZ3_9ACTN|nr:glycerol-3-phosphate acyltransferase [Rubrobacter taiwanensis]TCJ16817.1 glycerol-3-phosphate acyltransferase [Rubrobacter taiwanensis]